MKTCLECGKQFQAKRTSARFCSPKCRMSASRKKDEGSSSVSRAEYEKSLEPTVSEPVDGKPLRVGIESPRVKKAGEGMLTATHYKDGTKLHPADRGREQKYPGYHQYSDQDFERICLNCQHDSSGKPLPNAKTFKTRLKMNKFCSEACRP